jgi:alkylation response protein AidB-like acyl-CoA dehydrogenase
VAALETTAEKSSDGLLYVVNGSKKWVTQGLWADYCLAAVRTGGKGVKGISLLLIDLTSKGVSRSKMTNTGVAASGTF